MPVDDNIKRITYTYRTMNLLGKMHLSTKMLEGGGIFRILCTLHGYATLSTT